MTTSAACSTKAVMMKMAAMLNQRGKAILPRGPDGPRNAFPRLRTLDARAIEELPAPY
jgi:hypothetical protein